MSVRNLDRVFGPRRVVVIGASDRPGRVGRAVLANLLQGGFEGEVHPVNPRHAAVLGVQAYPHISDVPGPVDLAVICTPGSTVPGIIRHCGDAGVGGLIITAAGFGETGEEGGGRQQAAIRSALAEYPGLRAIGPNCLGVIVPPERLNASFAPDLPAPGHLAFVSQSGALCTAVLDWAVQQHVGFSHFVSVGNMADVDFGDLIDYLAADEHTRALLLYVESIRDARKFLSAARAFARNKPIVAYKAGRFDESARAATSHTGALTGDDDVYDAAFRRAGIERVFSIDDLFDCAELLASGLPRAGSRLAIVTNAGGLGVVATDALIERGGQLAKLEPDTIRRLDGVLPPHWSRGDPVDVLGDASAATLAAALEITLGDANADAALVVLAPQALTDPDDAARAVGAVAARSSKLILAAWMGGRRMEAGIERLNRTGLPVYRNVEDAVHAYMHVVSYGRRLDNLYETPRDLRIDIAPRRADVRTLFDRAAAEDGSTLSEVDGKALLASYGIPVAPTEPAGSVEDAVAAANHLGYPVVMKILSPQITHKTDVGGVALNLEQADDVRRAFEQIVNRARHACPDADIAGVTVQPMITSRDAIELILGAKRDPTFGSVILVGAGGTMTEVLRDCRIGLPPLNEPLVRRMLESLRIWPMLQGYRGRPAADVETLTELLIRFSYLIAENPAATEIDVNPLLARPVGAIALDARLVIDHSLIAHPPRSFSHLAIRPYPEEFTRTATLGDGTTAELRVIRPEDEPQWHELLNSCSPQSLWFRLGTFIKHTTHRMATRYCFIDYDREIAIVVEIEVEGERKLIGVGRLVADADHETAEFAILIADAWQGKGVGTLLTDYCLDVARRWDVRRVYALTLPQNTRMVRIFKRRGFDVRHLEDSEWIKVSLDLPPVASRVASPVQSIRGGA